MTEAMTVRQKSMPITTMADAAQLAKAFAQAHVMGAQNDPEGMLAVVLINEVGLVKAEATYHIMMGRLSKKAHAILAHFIEAGGVYTIVKRDAECAELVASIGENKDMTFRLSWEDALKEPFVYKGGPNDQQNELAKPDIAKRNIKKKYSTPRSRMQMLWARVVSDMGNTLCPDACEGMYPPEMVADFDGNDGRAMKTIDAEEIEKRQADASTPINYTVCPIGEPPFRGKPWSEFKLNELENALAMENPEITATHKAAIRLAIRQKEGK